MLDALLDESRQVFRISTEAASDKGRTIHDGARDWVDCALHVAVWRALRFHAETTGGRDLTGCETVDLVVHHQVRKVDIPACGMHKMVAANAVAVAISARHDDRQLVIRQFSASRHRQCATMKGMHPVRVKVSGKVGGTADAAHREDLVEAELELGARLLQAPQNAEIAAARTPVWIHFPFEIFCSQCSDNFVAGQRSHAGSGRHCIPPYTMTS